jgi:hypothetical protein
MSENRAYAGTGPFSRPVHCLQGKKVPVWKVSCAADVYKHFFYYLVAWKRQNAKIEILHKLGLDS